MTLEGSNPKVASPFALTKWVHNISRMQYEGSFIVRLFARGYNQQEVEVGREPILSRWYLPGCPNCQDHLDVELYVPIDKETLNLLEGPAGQKVDVSWLVKVQTQDGLLRDLPVRGTPGEDHGGQIAVEIGDL